MTSRPLISVFDSTKKFTLTEKKIPLPAVFTTPIRLDIVQFVHANLNKNRRQAHGVDPRQGHKHSAESWGTGRAVARIPRVSGSGTHRSGQAAFGNQCRKGRMFAPLKTWRRWHRRVNIKQKRHAVAAALAASALVPLVLSRGHKIQNVGEIPFVFDDKLEQIEKTKLAVKFLKENGVYEDVKKVISTKKIRPGKGKLRNNRYATRKGPLIIYANENVGLKKAVRNIPGVEICNVNRLNLLQLAPGGQLGRFIIWTQSAFLQLNSIFGTFRYPGQKKSGYQLNRSFMCNADVARIINSNEIQSIVRPARETVVLPPVQKKNPLKNNTLLFKLDPNAKLVKETARKAQEDATKRRQEIIQKKRVALTKQEITEKKALRKGAKKWLKSLQASMDEVTKRQIEQEKEWNQVEEVSEGEGDDFVAGDDDEVEVKEGDAATEPVAEKGKEPAKAEKGKEGDKGKEPAKKDAGKEPAKDAKKDAKKK